MLPLVYFTHADIKNAESINGKLSLSDYQGGKTSLSKTKLLKKLKLTIENESMNYEATQEDDSPFMIGILDQDTDKLSIVETPFFVLKPECYMNRANDDESNDENKDKNMSYSDKLNSLTSAFGSSRKRKAMQTKLKNKLDTETLDTAVNAAVKETIENRKNNLNDTIIGENSEQNEMNSTLAEQYSIIPTPNKNAKQPADVYDIEEVLISKSEIDTYTIELATKYASATHEIIKYWKEKQVYSDYICDRLFVATSSRVHQNKFNKCKLLAYMNFLLKLYQLKLPQLRSKTPLKSYDVSDALSSKLLDKYTVVSASNANGRNIRSMPRRLKDKLTCHIMILALHIDDYSTDLQALQKDLKISVQKLTDYYTALGCHIKSHATTIDNKKVIAKSALLTLPLNEVKPSESKKRGRK
jgi:DNA-directed RNA polymerase I subunit RPA49